MGAHGVTGSTGATGPTGIHGITGSTGATGPNAENLDHLTALMINDEGKSYPVIAQDSFFPFNKLSVKYGESIDQLDPESFIIKKLGDYLVICQILGYYEYYAQIQIFINGEPVSYPVPASLPGATLTLQEIIRIKDIPATLKIKAVSEPVTLNLTPTIKYGGSLNIIRMSE